MFPAALLLPAISLFTVTPALASPVVETFENAIYHGNKVNPGEALAQSTVDLTLFIPEARGVMMSICSGTLIGETTVLTAAHCVSETNKPGAAFVIRQLGSRVSTKVQKILVHPGFRVKTIPNVGQVAVNDLALLKIEAPLAGAVPAKLPSPALRISEEQNVTMAGFGRNGYEPSKEEIQQMPEVKDLLDEAKKNPPKNDAEKEALLAKLITAASRRPLLYTKGSASLLQDEGAAPHMQIVDSLGACGGDSGGPTYLEDKMGLTVIGVHSTSSNAGCEAKVMSLANDMYVPVHVKWIRENLDKL